MKNHADENAKFQERKQTKANHPFTGYNSLNILSLPVLLIHFDYIIIYLMGAWLNNGEKEYPEQNRKILSWISLEHSNVLSKVELPYQNCHFTDNGA